MIAETLAGISLVKAAVDGIKSTINTANDIGDIAGFIDKLFEGEKQVQQDRAKKSGMGMTDQFGVSTVAREVIDAKIAAEKLQEVATMVDMRFGHGTWKGILAERQKRIQEAKEAALKAKREAIRRRNEVMEQIKIAVVITAVVVVGLMFLMFAVFSPF
jgi:Fe2+ transport system protein B